MQLLYCSITGRHSVCAGSSALENSIQSSRAVFSGLQTQQGYNTVVLVLEPDLIVSLSAFPLFWEGEGGKKFDICLFITLGLLVAGCSEVWALELLLVVVVAAQIIEGCVSVSQWNEIRGGGWKWFDLQPFEEPKNQDIVCTEVETRVETREGLSVPPEEIDVFKINPSTCSTLTFFRYPRGPHRSYLPEKAATNN
jgi:hypothetical protein